MQNIWFNRQRQRAVTIFGFDYPDTEIQKLVKSDSRPQVQTQLFARRLTQAIQLALQLPVHCISAAPVSTYPISQLSYIRRAETTSFLTEEGWVTLSSIPTINVGLGKIFSRALLSLYHAVKRSFNQTDGFVIVYSVHVPFMVSGLLLARLTRAKSVAVWTDPPGLLVSATLPFWKLWARKIEFCIVKSLASRFDFVIALTPELAMKLAPSVPSIVVEAMTGVSARPEPNYRKPGKTVFTYTGGISRENGVDTLVEAIQLLPSSKDIVLKLYGSGSYASELTSIARSDDRIDYAGEVDHEDSIKAQTASDFLINARDVAAEFTRYSFPSKTLEYLSSGVPVLSTRLPGIPEEYWDVLIPIESPNAQTIASMMIASSQMPKNERMELGHKGRLLAREKTYVKQAARIRSFLLQSSVDK